MAITRLADTVYALRFLKLLTTPWEDTEAYQLGIVDEKGKRIKKPQTNEERDAYSIFHRLVFNIKRLLGKLPLGSTRLGSYAAAFFLIKEQTGLDEDEIKSILEEIYGDLDTSADITESWMKDGDLLFQGTYTLKEDIANPITGDILHKKGSKVLVAEHSEPVDVVFNENIYKVVHINTQQSIYVTSGDLTR